MVNKINILIASDINYAPYYGVMLTSLFMNNSESSFDIYLITDETWTEKETRKFEKLCSNYHSRFIIRVVEDAEIISTFPVAGHLNKATYYNLNIANLLPESVHRVIYMDGDMIVNGDIRPLWEMNLQGNACGMVLAPAWSFYYVYHRLRYDAKYGYFNNGTTLYDLDFLRKIHFSDKAIECINSGMYQLDMMDQDVTNIILHGEILRLPLQYNFQSKFFWKSYWASYSEEFKQGIIEAAQRPVIIHYSDKRKPWQIENSNWPYARLWDTYYKQSAWKGAKQIGSLKDLVKRILKRSTINDTFTEEAFDLIQH